MLIFLTTFKVVSSYRSVHVSLGAFALALCSTWNPAPLLGPSPSLTSPESEVISLGVN